MILQNFLIMNSKDLFLFVLQVVPQCNKPAKITGSESAINKNPAVIRKALSRSGQAGIEWIGLTGRMGQMRDFVSCSMGCLSLSLAEQATRSVRYGI